MTGFLIGDFEILPKKELRRSLQEGIWNRHLCNSRGPYGTILLLEVGRASAFLKPNPKLVIIVMLLLLPLPLLAIAIATATAAAAAAAATTNNNADGNKSGPSLLK